MTGSPPRAPALAPLVAALDGARVRGDESAPVLGLAHDSRAVRPGTVFVALRGERYDGHAFVGAALAAGARAVVVDAAYADAAQWPAEATVVIVPDTRAALSRLAAAFFARPSAGLDIVGVTGTNGKTTTIHMVAAILGAAGIPAGSIGTLGADFAGRHVALANTTPLALELQATLAAMRDGGARAVAMEISSHALAAQRVADVDVALGVLTNVTRDHLDFHGSFEAYAAAKRSLFSAARAALFNIDDPLGRRWATEFARGPRPVRTYGFSPDADFAATDVVPSSSGTAFSLAGTRFTLRVPGRFNVSNALAAIGAARSFGVADRTSAETLGAFESVPGRMERFASDGIEVLVDYAHTPDALRAVLEAAREATRGRLSVVFGCGGDRDRGKRPEMGRIACELADSVLVTSDNPRHEDPATIAREIVAGAEPSQALQIELERGRAIRRAICALAGGDTLVIAGKGHETYQIIGDAVTPFDDREIVRAALAERERAHV
jgi:UDP-N-acetylmuramoyl-L-alanyl-D-glutamate--2,6-diaminopimelate ligase